MRPDRTSHAVEVGIVEIDARRRQYKSALINGTPGMRTVWACASAKDALESFPLHCPKVVLVGLFLKDMPGTELVRRTRLEWPAALPILLIPTDQLRQAVEALEAGADGYLPAPCPPDQLIRAIWTVHGGGAILEEPVAKTIVDYFRARGSIINRLTEREREVLICLSEGLLQSDVAVRFGISKETVHTHVRNVLVKLGARSATQAVAFYLNPKMHAPTNDRHPARKI